MSIVDDVLTGGPGGPGGPRGPIGPWNRNLMVKHKHLNSSPSHYYKNVHY